VISVIGLELLIMSALLITGLTPLVLIYLLVKDIREGKLW
tara:strand:- start:17682 stop:17801 length:120 start_codon:yes stop_codon:yes gene_type:complete